MHFKRILVKVQSIITVQKEGERERSQFTGCYYIRETQNILETNMKIVTKKISILFIK